MRVNPARLLLSATGPLARYVLGRFLVHAAMIFVGLQGFVAVAAVARLLSRHPHVSPATLAARLPDVLLLYLPVSVPVVLLGALLATLHHLQQRRMLAQIELTGTRAYTVFAPVLVVVALVCVAMVEANARVLPQIRYRLLHVLETASADTSGFALRLAEDPAFLSGYRIRFEALEGDSLTNVRMTGGAENGGVAIVARAAEFRRVPETPFIELALRDGRLLRVSPDLDVQQNARFERLLLRRDVRALGSRHKTELISLAQYTDEELGRLADLSLYRLQRGIRPSRKQRRQVARVRAERWTRQQSAWLSLVFTCLAVAGLATHSRRRVGARTTLVVAGCLVVLMPAQLILESGAHRGTLDSPWLAWTPTAAAAVLIAAALVMRRNDSRVSGGVG